MNIGLFGIEWIIICFFAGYGLKTEGNDDFPPYPGAEPKGNTNIEPQRNMFGELGTRLVDILAGVWRAIIQTRNVIVYLIIIIVGFLLWPIGLFLIICFICWIFRR